MVINDSLLDEILYYLDNSISGLAMQQDFTQWNDLKNFLDGQYDIRLDNLLLGKSSSIHHLESGLKNKVIMRKRILLDRLEKEFEKK